MLAKSKTVAFPLLSCLPCLPLLLCIFVWPGLESRRAQAGGEELSACPAPAPATGALEAQAQPACAIAWPNFPSRAKRLSYSFDFGVGVGVGVGFSVFQTVSSTIWQSLLRYTSVDMRYDWLQYSISSLLPPFRRGVSLPAICNLQRRQRQRQRRPANWIFCAVLAYLKWHSLTVEPHNPPSMRLAQQLLHGSTWKKLAMLILRGRRSVQLQLQLSKSN